MSKEQSTQATGTRRAFHVCGEIKTEKKRIDKCLISVAAFVHIENQDLENPARGVCFCLIEVIWSVSQLIGEPFI